MSFVIQRDNASVELSGLTVRVGTHSTCELVLDDPLAADLHATITLSGRGLTVEPGTTSLGTYLDGQPITKRSELPVGSELILGASRIRVDAVENSDGRVELTVLECSFFHVAKRRGEFHSDADEWVRSETRFGRIWPLRWLNALAVVVVVTALATSLSTSEDPPGPSRAARMSAGPLSEVHARVFSEIASGDHPYSDTVAAAASRGCAACHTEGRVDFVTGEGCLQCHAGAIASMAAGAVEGGRHPFGFGAEASDCLECHREHRGGPRPIHAVPDSIGKCKSCHQSTQVELNQTYLDGAAAPETFRTLRASRGFEGFSHGAHAMRECVECHEPSNGSLLTAVSYSVPDSFASCASCHGSDAPQGSSAAATRASFQIELSAEQHARHGEGVCTKCHEAALEPGLLAALGPAPLPRLVEVPGHAHETIIESADCRECHLKPIQPVADRDGAAFDHGIHLGWGALGRPLSALPAARASCLTCHADMESAGRYASDTTAWTSCAGCHDDRTFTPPAPRTPPTVATRLAEFSHAAHVSADCAECHVVRGGEGAPLRVSRLVETATCASCHFDQESSRHMSAPGTEDCDSCHGVITAGAGAFAGAGVRRSELAPRASSGFSHAIEGHRVNSSNGCATCHRGSSAEVVVANEGGQLCLDCHQRTRFHWRYSSPK